jgi:HAMP domain-containing protein/type II secretory pathway pseudopilin PulG
MGLRAKFNLVLLAAFLVGLALAAAVSYSIVRDNARREVEQEANLMMAQALAVRGYTTKEIRPLLADQMKLRFLPHTVPAWAAQTTLRSISAQYPDYTYKEAALNPTNPADRAADWEADIVAEFQRTASMKEFTSIRDTPTGPILSVSRPIRITDKDCLTCHSTPAAAPVTMIDLYGGANGFNWKLGDVIGAQIVSVPMQVALDRANKSFIVYLGGLAVVFAVTLLLLNLVLHFVIIRPIRRMSAIAGEVSLGNNDAPEFTMKGQDEIASLAQSFNRMRRSLTNAMQMLER